MITIFLCLAAVVAVVGFYLALASNFFAEDVPGYADDRHQYAADEGDLQHFSLRALEDEFHQDVA